MLPGIKIFNIKKIIDERGFFTEVLRADWQEFLDNDKIVQVNLSLSKPGVVRAWHRHSRGQTDYITIIEGKVKICAYDDRENSQTKGELEEIILDSSEPCLVRIPGFYWHGTKCLSDNPSTVLYLVTKLYDYKNPDEERRIWNDPLIIDKRTNKPYDWNQR